MDLTDSEDEKSFRGRGSPVVTGDRAGNAVTELRHGWRIQVASSVGRHAVRTRLVSGQLPGRIRRQGYRLSEMADIRGGVLGKLRFRPSQSERHLPAGPGRTWVRCSTRSSRRGSTHLMLIHADLHSDLTQSDTASARRTTRTCDVDARARRCNSLRTLTRR
jgi:hypothetical protein